MTIKIGAYVFEPTMSGRALNYCLSLAYRCAAMGWARWWSPAARG